MLALDGCTGGRERGRTAAPPAALNHVYVVLDTASFAEIRNSAALAELLGRSDEGLPDYAPPSPSADRIFFRGRSTYLELFAPDNRFGEPVGKVGIGIGYDRRRDLDRLETTWRSVCGAGLSRSTVTYRRVSPAVPWYDALACAEPAAGTRLSLWAMTYRPDFHRWQSGGGEATDRQAVLAPRRAAGQGRFDVVALDLDVGPAIAAAMAARLRAAGFVRTSGGWRGDGVAIALRPAVAGGARLRSLTLKVDRARPAAMTLGNARLARVGYAKVTIVFADPAG